jgi:hypothetical protein
LKAAGKITLRIKSDYRPYSNGAVMSRVILTLVALSTIAASNAIAQNKSDDDDVTVKKAPTRAELLASKLKFTREITRVTKHKTKAGLPDYAAAINEHFAAGVKPEENGAILLYEALGPKPEGTLMPEEFFERMGARRPPADRDYFQPFGRGLPAARARELIDTEFNIAMTRPWSKDEFPEVYKWLQVNGRHVAKVIEGASRPKYFSPLIVPEVEAGGMSGLIATLLPGIQASRAVARFLMCRALLNIKAGNADAAWSDLMAMHRIGSMIAKGPTLIESLVGIAINQIAAQGDRIFLDQMEMTAGRLAKCRKDIAALPPMPDMIEQLDWCERMIYLDCVLLLGVGQTEALGLAGARVPGADEGVLKTVLTRLAIVSVDWNTVMRTGNEMYDRLIVAMKKNTFKEREAALTKVDEIIDQTRENTSFAGFLKVVSETGSSRAAMSEMAANTMVALLLPAVRAVNGARERSAQTRHNLEVAFALAEWKLKNGSYPESLDKLVPQYLAKVPFDGFAGKPLIYRLEGEGFLIYSIGQNLQDEGGRWFDDQPRGDDPRVRIPIPAEEYTRDDL